MKKKYFRPEMKCLFINNESLMDAASMQLNQREADDEWQGAKENTFLEEEDDGAHSLWDE